MRPHNTAGSENPLKICWRMATRFAAEKEYCSFKACRRNNTVVPLDRSTETPTQYTVTALTNIAEVISFIDKNTNTEKNLLRKHFKLFN